MIEDSYEKSEQPGDWITIPCLSRNDLRMLSWAASWMISPSGNIKCVGCAAEQASSRNDMPFIHEQHCRFKFKSTERPWILLKSIMATLPIAEPRQCVPF